MFKFESKKILIISPQPWGHLSISKHHYAKALSVKNEVLFLNAPEEKTGMKFWTEEVPSYPNLHVIRYLLPLPYSFFFHLRTIYKRVNLFLVSKKIRSITPVFDVCIDFGNYLLYDNIDFVRAEIKIYFPVDDFEDLKPSMRGSRFALSVSDNIIEKFRQQGQKCYFINHGLSKEFADLATTRLNNLKEWVKAGRLNIGYAGNLFIPFIDTCLLGKIIENNPDVMFHFFGSVKFDPGIAWQVAWYKLLTEAKNVKLYGSVKPEELAIRFEDIDAFLLCYKPDNKNYHAENSHKIFEYFSTGRVIISTPITIYKKSKLFCMSENNEQFEVTFNDAIQKLEKYNAIEYAKARILLSLDNEYTRQIERIEAIINKAEKSTLN